MHGNTSKAVNARLASPARAAPATGARAPAPPPPGGLWQSGMPMLTAAMEQNRLDQLSRAHPAEMDAPILCGGGGGDAVGDGNEDGINGGI